MSAEITSIRRVDLTSHVVDLTVTVNGSALHRIGHLPGEGWWCATCKQAKRCKQIETVRDIVPEMENR